MLTWLALACSPLGPPEGLALPDPTRDGLDGLDGPHGAAAVSLAAQARVTEVVPVTVVYPADEALQPTVTDAPVVVFVHGGLVAPERYEWLARHLATRGVVTVLPEAELLLAISQPGNGAVALDALRDQVAGDGLLAGLVAPAGPAAAMGHSLGGVLAARQWVDDPALELVVLLASFPAAGDAVEDQGGRPALSVGGTTDQSLPLDELVAESARFAEPFTLRVVTGMNHYAWTDDSTAGDLDGDGPLERPLAELRQDALRLIDAYLDVHLGGADPALLDGPFPGTEVP
jgi:Alpha/beta hydrolase family